MHLQTQSITTHFIPSITLPRSHTKIQLTTRKPNPFRRISLKCSLSAVSEPTKLESSNNKPLPAEVSRTIMELSSVGTLSTLTHDGWPLGVGVRFAVDPEGTPILCLKDSALELSIDKRSSLHVQLEQCGLRTPQCTIQGKLDKPEDNMALKRLSSAWARRFGEDAKENLVYVVHVERVLQMEDFKEDGVWVNSTDYRSANPDPLRGFAERLVNEANTNNMEDLLRFGNVYVDLDFQVSEVKMVWVDRLGFDMRMYSPQRGVFEVRIPFPREVQDERGAKSSFNNMSQLAWEVERNHQPPNFEKVKQLKQISYR